MGTYRGQITLVNVNDGNIPGVGIISTSVLYAISDNGTTPPSEGWQKTIPDIQSGKYLWTQTTLFFSNNTSEVSYTVSYQGQNGENGLSASAADSFFLKTNQKEILKFINNKDQLVFSPQEISVGIYKLDILDISGSGEKKVEVDLDINKLDLLIYDSINGQWLQIDNGIKQNSIEIDADTSIFKIDLNKIQEGRLLQNDFSDILSQKESVLQICYTLNIEIDNEKRVYLLSSFLDVRYGMNKDMASLNVKAEGIVASMQNSNLVFDGNGLTIKNGSFRIIDEDENPLLYSEEGDLKIKGTLIAAKGTFSGELSAATGTFSGELKAATGTFSGELKATTGEIGGFRIGEGQLYSTDSDIETEASIRLDGKGGTIYAKNVVLGEGAKIEKYLKIGENAYIKNATSQDSSFIVVKNSQDKNILQLNNEGTIIVGNEENTIIINGSEGSIQSQNFQDNLGWKISNNNSVFNDVTVRGSIKASVLEYGVVQAVGGMLLIRPSSRIMKIEYETNESKERTILELESCEGFDIGDYCLIDDGINQNYYKIIELIKNNKILVSEKIDSDLLGYPIVNFGKEGAVGIGINGSTNNTLLTPQAISVFEFSQIQLENNPNEPSTINEEDKDIFWQPVPRIILGKLPNEDSYGNFKNTYGLYAENVLLKGSLVTQDNNVSAGINTLYGENGPTSFKKFGDLGGDILLWAGASGISKEEIENSNFFVDKNGNLYASSGYFTGSIITNSTIETSTLIGTGEEPALTIKGTQRGILFEGDNLNSPILRVDDDIFLINTEKVVVNTLFSIDKDGVVSFPKAQIEKENNSLTIKENSLLYTNILDKEKRLDASINFVCDGVSNKIVFSSSGATDILELTNSQVKSNTDLYLTKGIKYNKLMEYKPVYEAEKLVGYDLYISEE